MQAGLKIGLSALLGLTFILSCSPSSDLLRTKTTQKPEDHIDSDNQDYIFDPDVDILFVVDDSGSMSTHQQNLATNINLFINEIKAASIIDYHIGVVTTDDFSRRGALFGNPNFVTKTTPNFDSVLRTNLLVGINGDVVEKVFDPIYKALTPPMVNGVNQGFYRKSAYLAILMITDTDDQSDVQNANSLYNFLLAEKSGDPSKILVYGALIPHNPGTCYGEISDVPQRITDFFTLTNGTSFSLCAPDFGAQLAKAGSNLANAVARVIRLTRPPIVSTIEVIYGAQIIPNDLANGWTYDPKTNSIFLGEGLVLSAQPAGTRIQVKFKAAEF